MRKGFTWGFNAWPPFAGMAFGPRSRFFESGELRLAILSLLSEGPKHGYQLMKEMEERSGGVYKASAGSMYPTLQQLEDEGLVVANLENGRRIYTLTDAGRAELASDPETVRRIWERAESYEDWGQWMGSGAVWIWGPLMELFKASMKASSRIGMRDDGADRIRAILERARRELDSL
jgi:DNA-binding PadR family transcriptional regulator